MREMRKFLKYYGIKRKIRRGTTGQILIFGLFITILTLAIWYFLYADMASTADGLVQIKSFVKPTDVITVCLAIAAVIVGFQQWRAVRWETAHEKFYDRREVANRRLENVIARASQGEDPYKTYHGAGLSIFDTWVYSEVDKLEYILSKYDLGHISPEQVCRSIRTFRKFCADEAKFRERADYFAHNGAYEEIVGKVVDKINSEINCTNSCDKKLERVFFQNRKFCSMDSRQRNKYLLPKTPIVVALILVFSYQAWSLRRYKKLMWTALGRSI